MQEAKTHLRASVAKAQMLRDPTASYPERRKGHLLYRQSDGALALNNTQDPSGCLPVQPILGSLL